MEPGYVIFDLDDTLVHSKAVRVAFAAVAEEHGTARATLSETLDGLPGRPAFEIFEALGLPLADARVAAGLFLQLLGELDERLPTVAYPDAGETLSALSARGATLMLSTGSSLQRAHKVLDQEGWDAFALVLGSDPSCPKGAAHYDRIGASAADADWTGQAVTVGDSARDMHLGAEFGVPLRIGVDRDGGGDARSLVAAGATHVVSSLADILPILAAA